MKKLITLLTMTVCFNAGISLAQEKNVFTFNVGNVEVQLLSEGQQPGNTGILIGATPEQHQKSMPEGGFTTAMNAFLIRTEGKNILIDTGVGRNLFDNLKSLNVNAEQIDAVLITHAHGDHIGGLLQNGQASFPNATLYLSQPEYDFWTSDEMMNQAEENRRAGFLALRSVVEVYKERLHLFTPDELDANATMLFPEIQGIATYGHTPGHTVFMVGSDKEKLLIWGDLTHVLPVQMRYPHLAVTYDVDTEQAVASRLKILEYVSKNHIPIAGMHIAYPAIGNIKENADGGYEFTFILF